ncbi:Hypothetical predicted protein [Marmota monax]|uniref:Peroxisomal membrane protein PEX14 n=1 Tax=Marmota monax TaxID=9995 RepID=A0A5E4BFD7_MARMO|nr:Hypothetical predicted protein [Marmota monax]
MTSLIKVSCHSRPNWFSWGQVAAVWWSLPDRCQTLGSVPSAHACAHAHWLSSSLFSPDPCPYSDRILDGYSRSLVTFSSILFAYGCARVPQTWGGRGKVGWRDLRDGCQVPVCTPLPPLCFLQKYLLPLILGGREDRKQLERMAASLSELSGSVAQTVTQVQTTLASVQELLRQQQQKVQELAHELATAKATTSTNWILESQNINELKSEINSLKGLLLNRRQFPPSPSAPKIPSWQIPVKSPSPSSPAAVNHHSSSDISPVSNESTSPSPGKESHSPEGSTATYHLLGPPEEGEGVVDVKGQVRMEVQGEEEKREDKEDEEDEEDDDVSHVDEEDVLGVQREDRRGGDGQINEQVEKLRRPEGASNENERD